MQRSYLQIKENDFLIYNNEKIYQADSIIIDVYDASILFSNFEKYEEMFIRLKQQGTKIYLKVDTLDHRKCYRALDKTKGEFISGFVIENPNSKNLRRFSLKARDYELKQKLLFRSIDFIVVIDSLRNYLDIKKILKSHRSKYIVLHDIEQGDQEYINQNVSSLAKEYKRALINSTQFTYDLNNLADLNQQYKLTEQAINKALVFVNEFKTSNKKQRQQLLENNSLVYSYQILESAKRLGIIDDYPAINFVVHKKQEKVIVKEPRIRSFYTVGEEIGNAVTHGIGVGLSIAALVLLVIKAIRIGGALELLSYIAFGVSSILLYLMSTIYHSLALGTKAKAIFQRFDHMTIYILIAGTYTPFSLVAIGGNVGIGVCIFLWVGALTGMLLNAIAFGRFRLLHMTLYVALGWVAILFFKDILANIETLGVILLVLGGVMYTLGIIFYSMKLFKYTHMVWHLFVIFGTVFHFFAIFFFVPKF